MRTYSTKYRAVHMWVQAHLGSPNECSKCGKNSNNSRTFHWSNISGKYLRDLTDWQRLCASCHKLYDHPRRYESLKREFCSRGHKMTIDNLYFRKRKCVVECKRCRSEKFQQWAARKSSHASAPAS